MRSATVRFSVMASTALLALALLGANLAAQSVSISVTSQFSPNPVPVGTQSTASVSATATPPTPPISCTLSGPSWIWWAVGYEGTITVDGNGPSATIPMSIDYGGNYSIGAEVMVTWTDSCGNDYAAGRTVTLDLTVVEVVSITPLAELSSKNIGYTMTKADFNITTNPPGYEDEDFVTVDPVTIQLGDNIVTATCGISSATTDVIGCQCSGSLSDLIVGRDGYDDSMNFTALVQGCNGSYTVTGSGSGAVIDGGDTSGSLIANQTHSGIVYISAAPPDGSNLSRLPTFLNGNLVYGLGGIPGSTETKQVNGQSQNASGSVQLTVTAQIPFPYPGGVGGYVGTKITQYLEPMWWHAPSILPGSGPTALSTSTTLPFYNPNQITSSFTVAAGGSARVTLIYHYTLDPSMIVFVNKPSNSTTTDLGNGNVKSVWEYAQANLAGQAGTSQLRTAGLSATAPDSAKGKTQIKTGAGKAQLWVATVGNTAKLSADWKPPLGTWSNTKITVKWH